MLNARIDSKMKAYLKARMELFPDRKYAADANSTLRLTYGKIEGSSPTDGMNYDYYTTLDGMIQKNNLGHDDFKLNPRMRELWAAKDYGQYAQDGELRVCFTGSNHTTGGNSGSPVLNGKGELIGINFDRSWESTMSDYMFDTSRCRNIAVDIRYVLWVVDKYAGAGHLVEEMNIIRDVGGSKGVVPFNDRSSIEKTEKTEDRHTSEPTPDKYLREGQRYQDAGDYELAAVEFRKAVKLSPNSSRFLNGLAMALFKLQKYDESMKVANQALASVSGQEGESHWIIGLCLKAQNSNKEAIVSFGQGIKFKHGKCSYDRGLMYEEIGNLEAACEDFKMASNLLGNEWTVSHDHGCE
jgi:tetratricopeptide (TPR) repeat protein